MISNALNMNPNSENMRNLRIIIAEDHAVVRHGIKRLIDEQDDMQVVAEAANGQQVLDMLASGERADIVLSDVNMPAVDGFALFNTIRITYPDIKTVALSMLDSERQIKKCFFAGCSAYLTKSAEPLELIYALRCVGLGKKFLCSESVEKLIPFKYQEINSEQEIGLDIPEFTEREIEILELIAKGMTNQEIADKIFLSRRTVEGHRQSLIDKSESRNTAVLVHYAMTHSLII